MIPPELLEIPQWVLWRYEDRGGSKPTKPPINPRTGGYAKVNDPTTWSDYGTAYHAREAYAGLGFVLTSNDPYIFIDLDGVSYISVVDQLQTYTEISPSGQGLHLVCRGQIPKAVRIPGIEIYQSERYMTVTGNVWPEYRAIRECNGELSSLWVSLEDQQIWHRAASASNGEKFQRLWTGSWQSEYPSQSEADFALINIIGYYTTDIDQIRRMFLASGLGQRDKAKRKDYLEPMLAKAGDNRLPELPGGTLAVLTTPPMMATEIDSPGVSGVSYSYTFPPGLVGSIAEYIYNQSPKPTIEVSLTGALALMAGICGRNWNVFGNGLNIYIIVLAETGVGKSAASAGISRLAKAVDGLSHFVGPSRIESGQGLISHVTSNPCSVVIQGEFGLTLKALSAKFANTNQLRLRSDLLDLYSKSGEGETLAGTARSKRENSSNAVPSPSLTLFAESTPTAYKESITVESIEQGLIPRFTTIQYAGIIQESNPYFIPPAPPSHLVSMLNELVAYTMKGSLANHPLRVLSVQLDADAVIVYQDFDRANVRQLNKKDQKAKELYSRASMKAAKIAALVAVGVSYYSPLITGAIMQWAVELTREDNRLVDQWFEQGETGDPTNERKRLRAVYQVIQDYYQRGWKHANGYKVSEEQWNTGYCPQSYIYRRVERWSTFYDHVKGVSYALNEVLQSAVDSGELLLSAPRQYRAGAKAYAPSKSFPWDRSRTP